MPEGFDRAEAAYQAALNGADQNDVLPFEVLEWWATLEARQAALLVQAAQANPSHDSSFEPAALCKKAKALLESAMLRIKTLMELSKTSSNRETSDSKQRRSTLLKTWQEQQQQMNMICKT